MSREIDERVVQMKFESGQFNRDIQTSIYKLDELKKGLDFKDASKGFETLDRAARETDMSALGKAVDDVKMRFSLLDVLALKVMSRISDAILNAANSAKRLVTELSLDQINPGWEKYAQKTSSVQTIMAATASQFSNTAEQMEVVNSQLDKLNWFTDETSYNFVDMVNNIGKFTSNNIALDQSVTAMQGIANWAAISGANAQEASRAMYNLAQALATGTVKLIDWKSIENANMATTEFKQTVIDIAEELGTLKKIGDNVFSTLDGKSEVTVSNFNEGLSKGWFTNEVLMRALNKYGAAANRLNEIYEALDSRITTSRLVSGIDEYTSALSKARSEAEKSQLSAEETARKVAKAGSDVAKEIAKEWGISIEQATEWLDEFDDATMQFGLKAFKAAQEAKTFREAIDSVKDAVSTGWMKTFETIFGDYTKAKELWTNVANILYDIFAAGGDYRNEMLKEWDELGGRTYFIDSLYGGLAAIMALISSIKSAWQSVFGVMTAQGLFDITKRFHELMVVLVPTEEAASKLARVFRGLFSIIDIIRMVIFEAVKGAFSILDQVLGALSIDLGEILALFGDLLYLLRNWIKESGIIPTIFTEIGNAIVNIIELIRNLIVSIANSGPVKRALQKLKGIFGDNFNPITTLLGIVIAVIRGFWDALTSFRFPKNLGEVVDFFKYMASSIGANLKSIGIDLSFLGKIFDAFKAAVASAFNSVGKGVTTTVDLISNAINYLNDLFKDVDWAGVLLLAFGVSMIAILYKFADALSSFAAPFKVINEVGKAAKKTFDSITGYFKALKDNVKTNVLVKIAISVTLVAAAFTLFAQLEWAQISNGITAIVVLGGALFVLNMALGTLDKLGFNAKGLSTMVLSIAAMIAALGIALSIMPDNMDIMEQKIIAIITIVTILEAMLTVFGIVNKKFGGEAASSSIKSIIALILGTSMLIGVMKKLGKEEIMSVWAAILPITALMGALGAISQLMVYQKSIVEEIDGNKITTKNGGPFWSIIGIVIGMIGLVQVIKMLAKIKPEEATKGIMLMIPLMIGMVVLFKASAKAGKEAASAGKMMRYLSVALAILIPILKAYANIDTEILRRGGEAIAAIGTFIFLPLIAVSKLAGEHAAKAGMMILEVSAALALLQLVIKTLGRVDLNELKKGVAAVSVVILALSVAIAAMHGNVQASEEDVKNMTKMIIIIGIVSTLIFLLTVIDPTGALVACTGLTAVFVSLGVLFKRVNKVEPPKNIIAIIGVMTGLAVVLGIIGAFSDWKGLLAICSGLSAVAISLGFMLKKLDGLQMPSVKKLTGIMTALGIFAVIITAFSHAAKDNIKETLAICTGLTAIVLAVGSLGQILKNSATSPALTEKLNVLAKFAYAMAGVLGVLGIVVAATKTLGGDINDISTLTLAISELFLALGVMGKLLGKMSVPSARDLKDLGIITSIVAAVGGVLAMIVGIINSTETQVDFTGLLTMTTSIGELMIALGATLRLANEVDTSNISTGQLVAIETFVAAMSFVLNYIMTQVNKYTGGILNAIVFTTALGELMIAMAYATSLLNEVEVETSTVGTLGLVALIATAFGIILAAIMTAMSGYEPNLLGAITFVGSMSILMIAMSYVATILSKVPEGSFAGAIEGLGLVLIIVGLMAALVFILAGISTEQDIKRMEIATAVMTELGKAIGGFFGGVIEGLYKGIGNTIVQMTKDICTALVIFFGALAEMPEGMASKATELLAVLVVMTGAELVAALSSLTGMKDILEKGAEMMKTQFVRFGKALKKFSNSISDLSDKDLERVSMAARALYELGELENNLISFKHVVADFLGLDNLEKFGERLESLGYALSAFSRSTMGVSQATVEKAVYCAKVLKAFEEELPNIGGPLEIFFGQDTLDAFGQRIREFGSAILSFYDKTQGIEPDVIEIAAICGKTLSTLEDELSPYGGLQSMLFGRQDLGEFGTHLAQFGNGLMNFFFQIEDIDPKDFDNVVEITEDLIRIEKKIDPQGGAKGFLFGDDSFASFGSSLASFGAALVGFTIELQGVDFTKIKKAINYVNDLVSLDDIGEVETKAVLNLTRLVNLIKQTIEGKQEDIKWEGSLIMHWIVSGMEMGIRYYSDRVMTAATTLAQRFLDAFEEALLISSPSLVMNQEGHWIVKGLAEGISEDTSAEEAAQKKAQNIVSAFEAELSKLKDTETTHNLEFELWKLTDGKNASESEVIAKQIELENEKLADLAKTVGARRAAMESIAEMLGEESDEYKKAYQNYLQAQIDMLNQQNSIVNSYGGNTATMDENARALARANYMAEYKEAYEMLGKSQEELENAAYKAIDGLDDDAIARKRHYDQIMAMGNAELEMLDMTSDELSEYAKNLSGWEGFGTITNSTLEATQRIIDENINSYSLDLEATMEQSIAEALEQSSKKASGAASAAGSGLADSLAQSFKEQLEQNAPDVEDTGIGILQQLADIYDDIMTGDVGSLLEHSATTFTDVASALADKNIPFISAIASSIIADPVDAACTDAIGTVQNAGRNIPQALGDGVKDLRSWYTTALDENLMQPMRDIRDEAQSIGRDTADNTVSGLVEGLESKESKLSVSNATSGIGNLIKTGLSWILKIESPSKVTMEYGRYIDEGLAVGMVENLGQIETATEEVGMTARDSLSNAMSSINAILTSDEDFQPVITPILDLDQLTNQANSIPGIIGGDRRISLSTSRLQVGSISANSTSNGQNGSGGVVNGPTYNFTQNNYSPKSLSRTEIYRQTNNQFSRFKEATKR